MSIRKYHFIQTLHWTDLNCLKNEMVILDTVAAKFRNYSASDFVDSIQEEAAFQQNQSGAISFLTAWLKNFKAFRIAF